MKKFAKIFFSSFLLISFLYVQLPFAAFHHHEHKPVCELNEHAIGHKPIDDTKKHFHENRNASCFLCSAQLLKEYQVKDPTFSYAITFVHTPYSNFDPQLSLAFIYFSSARAPPALA